MEAPYVAATWCIFRSRIFSQRNLNENSSASKLPAPKSTRRLIADRNSTGKANRANLFRSILSRAILLLRARCYHPPSCVARRHHAEITQPNVVFSGVLWNMGRNSALWAFSGRGTRLYRCGLSPKPVCTEMPSSRAYRFCQRHVWHYRGARSLPLARRPEQPGDTFLD
jgi:hypothetical protein